jgi:hypothetical protein
MPTLCVSENESLTSPTTVPVAHGGAYPAGGGMIHQEDEDFQNAAHHAARNADENTGFFGSIMSKLGERKHEVAQEDIDEQGESSGLAYVSVPRWNMVCDKHR